MNKQSFEEYLENNDRLIYRNTGTSMLPLLKQGRDFFIVEKVNNRQLKKYDVVLYKRQPDSYVLHRIIKIEKGKYVIMGDNCINKEYGITDNEIIAVMTGEKADNTVLQNFSTSCIPSVVVHSVR